MKNRLWDRVAQRADVVCVMPFVIRVLCVKVKVNLSPNDVNGLVSGNLKSIRPLIRKVALAHTPTFRESDASEIFA